METASKLIEEKAEEAKAALTNPNTTEQEKNFFISGIAEMKWRLLEIFERTGIDKYLQHLDYEQLKYAQRTCEALVRSKEDEEKIKIWSVGDDFTCDKWFESYDAAKEYLPIHVQKQLEKYKKPTEFVFQIDSRRVFKSELSQYIKPETT